MKLPWGGATTCHRPLSRRRQKRPFAAIRARHLAAMQLPQTCHSYSPQQCGEVQCRQWQGKPDVDHSCPQGSCAALAKPGGVSSARRSCKPTSLKALVPFFRDKLRAALLPGYRHNDRWKAGGRLCRCDARQQGSDWTGAGARLPPGGPGSLAGPSLDSSKRIPEAGTPAHEKFAIRWNFAPPRGGFFMEPSPQSCVDRNSLLDSRPALTGEAFFLCWTDSRTACHR